MIALNVLSTLTKYDRVNMVVSRSPYWDSGGTYYNYTSEVLGCQKYGLMSASPTRRQELANDIDALEVNGGSDHV